MDELLSSRLSACNLSLENVPSNMDSANSMRSGE